MAIIDEELRLARKAKAAIENIRRREKTVEILRNASIALRRTASPLSSEIALNEARRKVVNALTILIPAREAYLETRGQNDNARAAIDDWIKELKAPKP